MNTETRRLVDPEAQLAHAQRRLSALRAAALFGDHYDPDEYDGAVIAYRRALAEAGRGPAAWPLPCTAAVRASSSA